MERRDLSLTLKLCKGPLPRRLYYPKGLRRSVGTDETTLPEPTAAFASGRRQPVPP